MLDRMSTAVAPRPRIAIAHDLVDRRPAAHDLVESYAVAPNGAKLLQIDKDAGVIYGVKLGGLESPNTHGIPGVTKGTKYKASCYQNCLPLYEGRKVYPQHAVRGGKQVLHRGPFDYIGVIRNPRWDAEANCPRGDFHYVKSHPNTPQLVEDVERGMGGFGFSHHVAAGGFKGKVEDGWLVVESISKLKSVDLVDDPATTRNLWEGRESTVAETATALTLRVILEDWVADKSNARKAVAKALLEDDASAPMDAPVAPPDGDASTDANPEDELWQGFMSAIMAIINGDDSASDKAKQIGKYLKAHEKLTSAKEPSASDDDADSGPKESRESRETHELKAKLACLEKGVKNPPATLLKALTLLDTDADRKALIEQAYLVEQAAVTTRRRPTSGVPVTRTPLPRSEGKIPTGDSFRRSIKD